MIPGSANPLLLGQTGTGGYEIERSLRFNSGDSAYLNRTPSSVGNRKTFTLSAWVKAPAIANTQQIILSSSSGSTPYTSIDFRDNNLRVIEWDGSNITYQLKTNAVLRDVSAWYHVVFAVDTTQSTTADRVKIYVNGVQETSFATTNYPSQNHDTHINNSTLHYIGSNAATSYNGFLNCYLADVHFIDGQALAPTDFGETDDNGVWQPKKFAGTYGPLVDQRQTWSSSGSSSGWSGSYPLTRVFDGSVSNNIANAAAGSNATWTYTISNVSNFKISLYVPNISNHVAANDVKINGSDIVQQYILDAGLAQDTWHTIDLGNIGTFTSLFLDDSYWYVQAIYINDKLLVDSNITVGNNSFHLPFTDNSSNAALGTDTSGLSPANTWTVNNLSAGAVSNPTAKQNFDVVTYTGTGSSQSISSLAFQPDFVWIKNRNSTYQHLLFDAVRGATKYIKSDATSSEATNASTLASFNSNGFTLGGDNEINRSSYTYVAWAWKAGSAAVSNTDGTITSQVSANASYGFSIAKYTGTGSSDTFGHGLSTAPKVVIVKKLTAASWNFYHSEIGATKTLELNSTAAENTTQSWGDTAPTNSVVTVGNYVDTNDSGGEYIAYCWSEVAGFSKFGSWNGNSGSTTVTFGFKPRFVLWKSKSATNWHIIDSARGVDQHLYPNENASEANQDYYGVDFTDTGITINSSYGDVNASGSTYVYMAFAETILADPDRDSLVDSPTNAAEPTDTGVGNEVVGNYCTWNPVQPTFATTSFSNGNLDCSLLFTNGSATPYAVGNFVVSSGKWYWEITLTQESNDTEYIGIISGSKASGAWAFADVGAYFSDARKAIGAFPSSYGTSYTTGDVIGIALDADNGNLTFYKNGVSQGAAATGMTVFNGYKPFTSSNGTSTAQLTTANFGQRAFAYTAPSGYKSLNTANLPDPTIADGSKYFDTKLFNAANGTQTVSGYNFSPDLVWTKSRANAYAHQLWDQVRGANKALSSDDSTAEANLSNSLTFTSDGFTSGTNNNANYGSGGSVAWAWDAGSSNTTIAAGTSVTNQAQTWSSNITTTGNSGSWYPSYPATYIFDSTTTNYGHANGDGSVGCVVTLSFSPAVTCSANVSIYGGMSGSGTAEISINGGTAVALTSGSSATTKTTVSFSGTISSIVITKTSTGAEGLLIYGFEIDGNRLLDNTAFTSPAVPSIASTVRANPSAGFSVVSYTGTGSANTVGHGLNSPPDFIVCKNRDSSSGWWATYISSQGATKGSYLNSGSQAFANFTFWNNTEPTSSVFSIGANANTNASGDNFIAYCFSNVEGYCKIGQHTNGASGNQAFIYTGFRPAWILGRPITADWWTMYDSKRDPYNALTQKLWPNVADAEAPQNGFDFLSNGFKCIAADNNFFASSANATWIYMAFAEHPFKTARAR